MNLHPFSLSLILLFFSTTLAAEPEELNLPPFEMRYELGNDLLIAAESVISLKTDAQHHWLYQSHTTATGLAALLNLDPIHELSELEWHDGKLRSLHYQSNQKDKESSSDFNWQTQTLNIIKQDKTTHLPLKEDTYDHTSSLLLLSQAAHNPAFQTLEVSVNEQGTARILTFTLEAQERIRTPYGRYDSLKIRQTRTPGSQIGLIWLAPKLHYLPIRIEQHNKGKLVARMELTAFKRLPAPTEESTP
ncbi:MAG: DUF3108 domain-containing protein [Gammaproteobacteria bacterium]|nr:DUF3108 domain-containing protein [Gammaproteobacteria bacterium]